MMIFYKAVKYSILDICLGILFENISNKFIRDSKFLPLKHVPKVSETFSVLFNSTTGRTYYGVHVFRHETEDPEFNLEYSEFYFEKMEQRGRIIQPTLMGVFSIDIYADSLQNWFYIK